MTQATTIAAIHKDLINFSLSSSSSNFFPDISTVTVFLSKTTSISGLLDDPQADSVIINFSFHHLIKVYQF